MVANVRYMDQFSARWLGYLALSLCINALIIFSVEIGLPTSMLSADRMSNKMGQVRIALKTMRLSTPKGLPTPEPQMQPVIKKQQSIQQKRISKPVVTKAKTKQKMLSASLATDAVDGEKVTAESVVEPTELIEEMTMQEQANEIETDITPEPFIENHTMSSAKNKMGDEINMIADAEQNSGTVVTNNLMLEKAVIHEVVIHEATIYEATYRKKTVPNYPRRAWELGQQGVVMLHAKVMPSGHPDDIKVVASSGYRLLDKAALAAVKKWEFVPTNINGQATVSWVSVPVNFIIQ